MRILKLGKAKAGKFQKDAVKLCKQLQLKGGPHTFFVGGSVRDVLLNRKNFDVDLATEVSPAKIKRLLNALGLRFFDVGEKYGTIAALLPSRGSARGRSHGVAGTTKTARAKILPRQVEITTFRAEKNYFDFRHPATVSFINLPEQDARRRDFTINALFFNPASNEVIDYVGGLADLKSKKIKFVGSAARRIKEDPLRMLRAIRFATALRFKIASKDFAAIKKQAGLARKISGDRIKQELDKIMADDNFIEGVRLLDKSGLLKNILPEAERLKTVKQSRNFHAEGNVFVHTLKVLEHIKDSDLTMRYAGLLHDIGKFGMGKKVMREGRRHITFRGHAQYGAELFKKIAPRLRFTNEQTEKIAYLISHHMDLRAIQDIQEETLIRWSRNLYFLDLIELRIADSLGAVQTSAAGRIVTKETGGWRRLKSRVRRWQKPQMAKIIDGNDVIRELKIKPGKKIGEILDKIFVLQKKGIIKTRQQGITWLKSLDKPGA